MMVNSDTTTVKQAQRATNPEKTGAQTAQERCYKGKDKAHKILSVLDCIEKIFISLVEILGMDTQNIN